MNRWLYNGLHSLNFPWLYNYRPLWDIVVITLMLGGTALCVTSLVLAWRVLGRKLARALNARGAGEGALSEDLGPGTSGLSVHIKKLPLACSVRDCGLTLVAPRARVRLLRRPFVRHRA